MTRQLTPLELQACLDSVVVIDVRHPIELVAGRISGSLNIPLSRLNRAVLPDGVLVFVCASGYRTSQAIAFVQRRCPGRVLRELSGGFEQWQLEGLPIKCHRKIRLTLMRQSQIAAGALVLLGLICSQLCASAWIV